jgi:hypothetical protein
MRRPPFGPRVAWATSGDEPVAFPNFQGLPWNNSKRDGTTQAKCDRTLGAEPFHAVGRDGETWPVCNVEGRRGKRDFVKTRSVTLCLVHLDSRCTHRVALTVSVEKGTTIPSLNGQGVENHLNPPIPRGANVASRAGRQETWGWWKTRGE